MEKKSTHKSKETPNKNFVSEPQAKYEAILSDSEEKTYSHEEVFGNLRKKLKAYYNEK